MTKNEIHVIAKELKLTVRFAFLTMIIFKDKNKEHILGCFGAFNVVLYNENKWNFLPIKDDFSNEETNVVLIGDEIERIFITVNPAYLPTLLPLINFQNL